MNKLYIIAIALMLTACSTVVPVTMKFPQAPESLMSPSEPLIPLNKDKRELSDLIDNATYNYGNYYQLEMKYKAWQDWYETQKKIFEEVK
jgi:hypothetical protein